MADESQLTNPSTTQKRKRAPKQGSFKSRKKINNKKKRMIPGMGGKKVKINEKMKKLFKKRAREYNSDDSEEEKEEDEKSDQIEGTEGFLGGESRDGEDDDGVDDDGDDGDGGVDDDDESEMGSDDGDEVQPGITKFDEGCKAFRVAFSKIMKIHVDDESLGPILSANKKLVATKLAKEEEEKKVKGEAKKAKHLIAEKGHVKPPANYLDSQEKFLISVATKGVVKLFNAINKAQHAVKQSDPSTSKNEKAWRKRRYQVFFSELKKSQSGDAAGKAFVPSNQADKEQPSWAPLRDNYLLTDSKLKNWDKMAEMTENEDSGRIAGYSSDDDDED